MRFKWGETAVVLGLGALAFVIRCLNFRGVFDGPDVFLYGIDSYAHMRRIWLTLIHFPKVPTFDYFINFPNGADIPLPVGFDLLLAAVAWLLGLGSPTRYQAEVICALAIPVLGALNVVLLYAVGRVFYGRLAALLAALFVVFAHAHVNISQVGRVDHHVAETFFVLLIALPFILAIGAKEKGATLRYSFLAGVFTTVSFLFWAGSIVFAVLPCLLVLALFVLRADREMAKIAAGSAAVIYASSALLLLPLGFTSPFFMRLSFTPVALSWFQIEALVVQAAVCAVLALRPGSEQGRRWRFFAAACVAGAVSIGALSVVSAGGEQGLRETLSYLFGKEPLAASTIEGRSLFFYNPRILSSSFSNLWVLGPAAFVYLAWKYGKERFRNPAGTFLLVWTVTATLLAGSHFLRYRPQLVLPLGLVLGVALADLYRWNVARFSARPLTARGMSAGAILLAAVIVPAWLMSGTIKAYHFTRKHNPHPAFSAANEAFKWLRVATPDPGGRLDPRERPRYGVLAPWEYGHWLNYIAERPNIASPFILLPAEVESAVMSLKVLFETDEARAARMSRKLGANYVVATDVHPNLESFTRAVGRPLSAYRTIIDRGGSKAIRFHDAFFRILNNRMLLYDGSETTDPMVPALNRFRLIYESPQRFSWNSIPLDPPIALANNEISNIKIFERVEGALLKANARPRSRLRAEIEIRTNQGRTYLYTTSTFCDAEGAFTLRLPYATRRGPDPYRTGSLGSYRIIGGGLNATLVVTEEEVQQGSLIPSSRLQAAESAGRAQDST